MPDEQQARWEGRMEARVEALEKQVSGFAQTLADMSKDLKSHRHELNGSLNTILLKLAESEGKKQGVSGTVVVVGCVLGAVFTSGMAMLATWLWH